MADEFGDASIVAERDGELMGFVVGLCPPRRPDTVFVWQVGVMPNARGLGLGRKLLDKLVDIDGANHVRYLEATVTPTNEASRGLFTSFARHRDAECKVTEGYTSEDFQPLDHEPEERFRIGPFR
jgi:L-2,4-diaminobutyric acid acetyltransferase